MNDWYRLKYMIELWLQHHQDKLPYLSKLGRRLFSIPATSASVEREFSAGGLLINERRLSLNPDTVENVLFVHSMQRTLEQSWFIFLIKMIIPVCHCIVICVSSNLCLPELYLRKFYKKIRWFQSCYVKIFPKLEDLPILEDPF